MMIERHSTRYIHKHNLIVRDSIMSCTLPVDTSIVSLGSTDAIFLHEFDV